MNILGITFLAVFLEGTITYLFGKSTNGARNWIKYISLLAGVALAIAYKVDIPSMAGLAGVALINYIVSGIVIGRGSNYVNDLITSIKK